MKSRWLPRAILRVASFLAPGDQRSEWLLGWRSELWYVPPEDATTFCLGSFCDALWLRRNNPGPVRLFRLESPFHCLAFLAAIAAVTILIAIQMPAPRTMTPAPRLSVRELAMGSVMMLIFSGLLLPTMRLVMGRTAPNRYPMPWQSRLRRWAFLALKLALVQPIMLCGFFILVVAAPVAPVTPLGVCASWLLALRWVLIDQQRRCPLCLRLLTEPVRIGTPSETFLEWYGAESMCPRGHGLLQISASPASYSDQSQWLRLDDSWSGLFSNPVGVRQR